MKNVHHYSHITFMALLVATFIWGNVKANFGIGGVIIVAVCWAVTRILKDGIVSLMVLMSQDDDPES